MSWVDSGVSGRLVPSSARPLRCSRSCESENYRSANVVLRPKLIESVLAAKSARMA